jgi:hypothetical protein
MPEGTPMKSIDNKSFTTLELIIVLTLIGAAGGFLGNIKIPFVKTKADVQKELAVEKDSHKITKDELASANKLTGEQKSLLEDLKKGAEKQVVLDQSAANAVAKITAVNELMPPVTRKDKVVDYAAQEAAKALPVPTDYAAILKVVKDQLDELKTSNAELASRHIIDLGVIDAQKKELEKVLADIKAQQTKVDQQIAMNAQQKADNDKQRSEINDRQSLLNQALEAINRFKYAIMGLVGLAGVLCVGSGAVVNNKILIAKGILLVVLASLGMIIPIMWYLAAVGVALLAVVAYVASQWNKEKSIADNAVGILGEIKQKAPIVWTEHIKPIAGEYWGTGVKDIAKANAWVDRKLYDMNMLPQDKKP